MKAAVIAEPGGTPQYEDFADPAPAEGRQIVEVVAAGIHPVVRSHASGRHYRSAGGWPRIPGVDAVARTAEGRLVYTGWPQPPYGTLAERVSVPVSGFPVPDDVDPALVAGGMNPGGATWLPLYAHGFVGSSEAAARPLRSVVVLGATGVAGRLAVQNARLLGATSIVAVGRNHDALEETRGLGSTRTVALTGDGTADSGELLDALGETMPDIVLDLLWGTAADSLFAALMRVPDEDTASTYVQIGSAAGESVGLSSALLRSHPITVVGSGAGSTPMSVLAAALPRYLELIASGQVVPSVAAYPLADVATAWEASFSSAARTVVTP